ncbi:MAG TPA: DUF445 domain-containing protein [Patescibacteria group bacterium]|nr:DUF445 domain-containing protein [Patescibacteria group bacterium]
MAATTSNRFSATVILALVTVGYFCAYPFNGSFGGGLLASGFGAAMVGGIADWFAVTALFRRPLGIGWRTAIIPRNREKVFFAMRQMVEKELLTPDNIAWTLSRYDMPDLLLRYLDEHGGREDLQQIAGRICRDLLDKVPPEDVGRMLEKLICGRAGQVDVAPAIAQGIEWSLRQGYDQRLLGFFLDELVRLAGSREMEELLRDFIVAAKREYEQDMTRRRLMSDLLEGAGISTEQLTRMAQQGLQKFLTELRQEDHPLRLRLREWLAGLAEKLKTHEEFRRTVEEWKLTLLKERLDLRQPATEAIAHLRRSMQPGSGEGLSWIDRWMTKQLDEWIDLFRQDQEQRQVADRFIKQVLRDWIESCHGQIGGMVEEKLSQFSDTMLVDFIETRVGNDLQMIRINGSVVGGAVGILLYLLQWLLLTLAPRLGA